MKRAIRLGLLLLLLGCSSHLPGESVGTYRVVMTLAENTCGPSAVYTQDGKSYSVELREDAERERGYWHRADTQSIEGSMDAERNFKFAFSSVVASESADAGPNGCQIVQDEVLSGSLRSAASNDGGTLTTDAGTAGEPLSSLVGEHVLLLSGYAGTDCSRALGSAGGPFAALPCTVRYTLSGTKRDPF